MLIHHIVLAVAIAWLVAMLTLTVGMIVWSVTAMHKGYHAGSRVRRAMVDGCGAVMRSDLIRDAVSVAKESGLDPLLANLIRRRGLGVVNSPLDNMLLSNGSELILFENESGRPMPLNRRRAVMVEYDRFGNPIFPVGPDDGSSRAA